MTLCKVWDGDYPWDVRVEKVCRSLCREHEVHLVRNLYRRAERTRSLSFPFAGVVDDAHRGTEFFAEANELSGGEILVVFDDDGSATC